MKIKNTKLSKRTLALMAATALLFTGGSFTGTKAALTYFSNDYTAEFSLDHIHVHLLENGNDVCKTYNTYNTVHRSDDETAKAREKKYRGNLFEENLGYKFDGEVKDHQTDAPAYTLGTPGTVEPGKTYPEEIKVRNGSGEENKSDIPQYVRLTVRKYWVKTTKGADGKETRTKDTTLSPNLIKLSFGKDDYNKSAWILNSSENKGSSETQTYYYKKILKGGETSEPLFDSLTIDKSVADVKCEETTSKVEKPNGKSVTVITYKYDYDGYTFFVEADVQAIQTHNVNDAIGALWGVSNVSAKNGVVTVK